MQFHGRGESPAHSFTQVPDEASTRSYRFENMLLNRARTEFSAFPDETHPNGCVKFVSVRKIETVILHPAVQLPSQK